ncbi:hypothetical protein [Humidesulfovibrio idahonensis]
MVSPAITPTLNQRFKDFFSTLSFAESIDLLQLPPEANAKKRADYFISNRSVIVELKALESDPEHKVKEELAKHEKRDDYPVFLGKMELFKILRHLPDGNRINEKLFYRVSRSIEQSIREADKQIASTKQIFNCNSSCGIVIILNENIDILTPQLITTRVSQQLTKRDSNGELHYKNIDAAWIVFENFVSTHTKNTFAQPTIFVLSPSSENNSVLNTTAELLEQEWARYNKIPLIQSEAKTVQEHDFKSKKSAIKSQPLSNHEVWREQYRNAPYLRSLSDNDVLAYGKRTATTMEPHFLKDGHKLPTFIVAKLMKDWTCFLEEASFRGLNLKAILR